MAEHSRARHADDPFLRSYTTEDLRIASEFLNNWIPFLSRGLCKLCVVALSDRIRSLQHGAGGGVVSLKRQGQGDSAVSFSGNLGLSGCWNREDCDAHLIGSWKGEGDFDSGVNGARSRGSWKDGVDFAVSSTENTGLNGCWDREDCDTHSIGSWKDQGDFSNGVNGAYSKESLKDNGCCNDGVDDTNSLGSWKEEADWSPEPVSEVSTQENSTRSWKDRKSQNSVWVLKGERFDTPVLVHRRGMKTLSADISQGYVESDWKEEADWSPEPVSEVSVQENSTRSWKDRKSQNSVGALKSERFNTAVVVHRRGMKMLGADTSKENEFDAEEGTVSSLRLDNGSGLSLNGASGDESKAVVELSREQREYMRFNNVKRKKDFICLERINGKIVNILDGLELHTGVFSAAEQARIVEYVEKIREKGQNGQLKERTHTAPSKWMRGKGRVTIQFGCCYNYATDKKGNPPGILRTETVDPIPQLLKGMIKRLVKWHVIPPDCVPDSCIVNIYEEGDCIPPHIDNHDFVRPFCTVSFLSECDIVFGLDLKTVGPGEFDGPIAIPLPVGSVLVLNGKGADVAKHCVPAVPTKRISITFRRMDESKRPVGYVPEPDLQGLQPLSYEAHKLKRSKPAKQIYSVKKQAHRREENVDQRPRLTERGSQLRPMRPRVRVNLEKSADRYIRTVRLDRDLW